MSKPDEATPSWRDIMNSGLFGRLALLCFGVWLHAADGLMVATIIPGIIADIGGAHLISWSFALYEVGSIVAGVAGALVSQRYSLRNAMVAAALLYTLGCLISALSPNMPVMLTGRLAQGLGGGGLMALSLISVTRLFPRELMPRAMAAISLIWGASAFTGPLIGGVFAHFDFWRGSFLFFALQAVALSVWIYIALRDQANKKHTNEKIGQNSGHFPGWRLLTLAFGVVAIASAGINVSISTSPILAIIGIALLIGFLQLDANQSTHRLLPARPFDIRHRAGAALLLVFCLAASSIAISIYGPVLMMVLFGVSALTAGYILALSSIGWSVLAVITSGAHERYDSVLIFTGMCCITVSIVGFMVSIPNGPLSLIAFFAFLEGAGFGMSWTFILRKATATATEDERDRIASALPTIQRLGYAVGASYIGIIANAVGFSDKLEAETARSVGFWIFLMCLPLASVGFVAGLALFRHHFK